MEPNTFTLTGPVTITFTPQQLLVIEAALQKVAYEHAMPLLKHIYAACQPPAKEEAASVPQP